MEKSRSGIGGAIEENTLAILDASEATKHTRDADDDRIAFLEAVRATSLLPENKAPPTFKMCEAVFKILRFGKSLELITTSYQLLNELDRQFPRVYMTNSEGSSMSPELVVLQEAWTPFVLGTDISDSEKSTANDLTGGLFDPHGLHLLLQGLAEASDVADFQASDTKVLRDMLLFHYLVSVLEGDFGPRNQMYKESMNWIFVRESLLNMILCSRKMNYKGLMKDCMAILCGLGQSLAEYDNTVPCSEASVVKQSEAIDTALTTALLHFGRITSTATLKLMVMVMELDSSKKYADMQGHTTRADGVRTPLAEIIQDELTYDKNILLPFLQVFKDSKWKLEIIVQFFWKYISKPSVRTRRSNGPAVDATFSGVLKCISNSSSTKSITKKISAHAIQLLLAHGFQAFLLLSTKQPPLEGLPDSKEQVAGGSLVETCKNLISIFNCLRTLDEELEISSCAKEALFVAATILSKKL
ncbi:negative regulator of systemic acquired resistance SNI1 isoform X1 [Momordica charantia]|uniref:Negative regulator of systemic acquired resistance SNI1 isoform X1 n=1 Tax=Momordica charantia TaxID=3673 RepID=A0A6J1CEG0_MOMCH|nr:negative regulator of systemic acquired resistance SNI1 isoform X1 [Momordica charantia]